MTTFADLGVPAPISDALAAEGKASPFPIQERTLPDTLAGRDVLGRGKTGSGKTLAFSVPLVTRLAQAGVRRKPGRPTGLVLSPTRELATQIATAMEPLAAAVGLRVTTVFGGVKQSRQESALRAGADIVVASLTKFYTGNGSALGGILVDGGSFDWTVERDGQPVHEQFVTPDAAYHGLKYADLGPAAYGLKARVGLLRDTGASISPFNAWVTLQGLDTLPLRIERHNSNAVQVVEFLRNHPKVSKVNFAGAADSPYRAVKEKLGLEYTGSVFTFELDAPGDDRENAWRFIDALQLHSNLANVGDVRSLVVHPASTTHSQSDEAGLARAQVTQKTIRLSV